MTTLNIQTLDLNNPIIQKLNQELTFDQKEIFIQQFYGYIGCDEEKDFVIDLDNVYEWLGFTRKDNAKRLLKKHFVLDKDYKINVLPREEIRGANPEQILMTIRTFKKFCMKADTKKADEIHDYFLVMERIINQQVKESSIRAVAAQKEKMILEHSKNKAGVYFIKNLFENIVKFGSTCNITTRVKTHKRDFGPDFYLDKTIETLNYVKVENSIRVSSNSNDTYTDTTGHIHNEILTYKTPEDLECIYSKADILLSNELPTYSIELEIEKEHTRQKEIDFETKKEHTKQKEIDLETKKLELEIMKYQQPKEIELVKKVEKVQVYSNEFEAWCKEHIKISDNPANYVVLKHIVQLHDIANRNKLKIAIEQYIKKEFVNIDYRYKKRQIAGVKHTINCWIGIELK